MKIYVDEMPKSCAECKCCVPFRGNSGYHCVLTHKGCGYIKKEIVTTNDDCPLQSLADHDAELLNRGVKEVTIPACEEHQGLYSVKVRLRWICPVCGKPRGEIKNVRSYDGSQVLFCDGWINPCGHIDKYEVVRKEAKENGLNEVKDE